MMPSNDLRPHLERGLRIVPQHSRVPRWQPARERARLETWIIIGTTSCPVLARIGSRLGRHVRGCTGASSSHPCAQPREYPGGNEWIVSHDLFEKR
jgi:hypothetical protein